MRAEEMTCPGCELNPPSEITIGYGGRPFAQDCSVCKKLDWVAHPRALSAAFGEAREIMQMLVDRRNDIELIGMVSDEQACYSFDDWALIRLDGKYWLLNTSGCSCPSPSEEWSVQFGPGTLTEAEVFLKSGKFDGYTVPGRQMQEFVALLQGAT